MCHTIRGEVPYPHCWPSLGIRGTGQSRWIRSRSPCSRSECGPSRTDHRATQGNADDIHRVSQGTGNRKGTSPAWHRQWCPSTAKDTIHQLWQCKHPLNDTTPSWKNGIQNDHLLEVWVQGWWVRKAVGSDNKHNGLFHWPWQFWTSLTNRGIAASIKEMMMAAGMRMWDSKMFTKDQMVAWENKTTAQ